MELISLTNFEKEFIELYGQSVLKKISTYIFDNEIQEAYLKSRDSPKTLFEFGLHYGILEIVAFCYCHLKCPININEEIQRYVSTLESSPDIFRDSSAVFSREPLISGGGCTGITIRTLDKFTEKRNECIKFLIRMKRFSCYTVTNGKFLYQIVDKYVKPYRLLEVSE